MPSPRYTALRVCGAGTQYWLLNIALRDDGTIVVAEAVCRVLQMLLVVEFGLHLLPRMQDGITVVALGAPAGLGGVCWHREPIIGVGVILRERGNVVCVVGVGIGR